MNRQPSGQQHYVQRVNAVCQQLLSERSEQISRIDPQGQPLVAALQELTKGGKKLRPVLAWLGFRAACGTPDQDSAQEQGIDLLGAGLELFQAAALVHDDIIDRSSTRRGRPSAHRRFEQVHTEGGFSGDTEHFGTAGGILTGDLALSWATEAFAMAAEAAATSTPAAYRQVLADMHTEVMTGQYLDVLSEVRAPATTEDEAIRRARHVLRFKSARYSTMRPIELGAALGGAEPELTRTLAAALLPVGEAFQLRDDLLGVFGDPASTGKPVGDDLREGKRTELIAYGLFRSPAPAAATLEVMLGRADLSESDVELAREILTDSGAVAEVENSIQTLMEHSAEVLKQLPDLGVSKDVVEDLAGVSARLVNRTA